MDAERRTKDLDLQRANGEARIALRGAGGACSVEDLFQSSPCRVLLPRVDGRPNTEVVLINTTGGVAGGDRLRYGVELTGPAQTVATTQASEKIYRALDADAHLETRLAVSEGGCLFWLPQPTIAFDGARFRRRTKVTVSGEGRLLALEWLVLGRREYGECFTHGLLRDDWRVTVDGRLLWADAFRLGGEAAALARRPALLGGHVAVATLVYVAPSAPEKLDAVRADMCAWTDITAGATAMDGILIMRLAARRPDTLLSSVAGFLRRFGDIAGVEARLPPRLWAS